MQTGNKSYSCVQCNLSFKMTKDLKTHMLQHDVKKPHGCNQCGYSNRQCFKAENTQAGSQWRKTFCLHIVQLFLHNSWQPQEAHAETLRREAFQLQTVQLFLHENGCPKDTHANTFGKKTFRLHTVQLLLHTNWESQDIHVEGDKF